MTTPAIQPAEPLPPLFEGGPKGPQEGKHQDFHYLSWAFHKMRYDRLGDQFYDPWSGKHLKCCKHILKVARDDREEIVMRIEHLWQRVQIDPDFYGLTPQQLLQHWDKCYNPPMAAVGGKAALVQSVQKAGRAKARTAIQEKYGD